MSNSQESLSREQNDTSAATPGKTLRRLREEAELSVEAVSEATKISVTNIRAIEEETYEKLPAETFVRGLVTLYGNFLGIDGSRAAAEFLAKREKNDPAAGRQTRLKKTIYSSSLSPRKLAEPSHISSASIALSLLVIIIVSFTAFSLYTSWNPLAFLSQQTENMQTSMQGIFSSTPEQEAALATTDEQLSYTLSVHFLKDSEVVVKVDDLEPVRQAFKGGEIAHWSARNTLQVTFDKPEAATLTLNDNPLAFPEPNGNQLPTLQLPGDLLDQ